MDNWGYEVAIGGLPPRLDQCLRLVQSQEVARRELLEEVGGTARELRYVGQFYTSSVISNEVACIYLATGVACPDGGSSGSKARPIASQQS